MTLNELRNRQKPGELPLPDLSRVDPALLKVLSALVRKIEELEDRVRRLES